MMLRMDFEQVLRSVLAAFAKEKIRYAAIGGFALGALGVPRATSDFDILVHRDDLDRLDQTLVALGYRREIRMENVSHYRHPQASWGGIDVLHAFRKPSLAMLERAQSRPVFGQSQHIMVLQPEDIIGLKVQAMANNPIRRPQDQADIEAVMTRHGRQLDWDRIQEYYEVFDLGQDARQLRTRFAHAQ